MNPEWRETHELFNYAEGDALTFTVMDWDLDRTQMMGQATLDGSDFYPDFSGEVQLFNPNGRRGLEPAGSLQVQIQVFDDGGSPASASTSGKLRKMLRQVSQSSGEPMMGVSRSL